MKILDALDILQPFARRKVTTVSGANAAHAAEMTRKALEPWSADLPVVAYVNHNRWLADCPSCRSGMGVARTWAIAWCFECGFVGRSIVWPKDKTDIEAALTARVDRATRNWQPGESADALVAENVERGIVEVRR